MISYKKFLFVSLLSFVCCVVMAQQTKLIVPFKIRLTNDSGYTYKDLSKNRSTILVYFDPDCNHCVEFVKALLSKKSKLANKQIVFITYASLSETKLFDRVYKISQSPYFKIGTEGYSLIVQKYFNIQRFPFLVFYDKQQKEIKRVINDNPGFLASEVINFN